MTVLTLAGNEANAWQSLFLSPAPPRFIKKLEHSWKALVYDGVSGSALARSQLSVFAFTLLTSHPSVLRTPSLSTGPPSTPVASSSSWARGSSGKPSVSPKVYREISPCKTKEWICREDIFLIMNWEIISLETCVSPSDSPPASFFCFVFCPPLSSPGLLLCKRLKAHDPLCAEMCAFIQFVPLSNTFKLWNLGLCVSLYVSGHGAPGKRFGFVRIELYWETKVHSHGPLRINFGEKKKSPNYIISRSGASGFRF